MAKELVMWNISKKIESSGIKSTTSVGGLIHMLGAIESAEDGHDIHYYCKIAAKYRLRG